MRSVTDFLVVHCSATRPGQDIGVAEIDEWHRAPPREWDAIGYHAVVRLDGSIEFGRQFDQPGAHVKGFNRRSVGVCIVGGLDQSGAPANTYSKQQLESLKVVLRLLRLAYPNARILGHRDLSPDTDGDGVVEQSEWLKDCPCFDVPKWVDSWAPGWNR